MDKGRPDTARTGEARHAAGLVLTSFFDDAARFLLHGELCPVLDQVNVEN